MVSLKGMGMRTLSIAVENINYYGSIIDLIVAKAIFDYINGNTKNPLDIITVAYECSDSERFMQVINRFITSEGYAIQSAQIESIRKSFNFFKALANVKVNC